MGDSSLDTQAIPECVWSTPVWLGRESNPVPNTRYGSVGYLTIKYSYLFNIRVNARQKNNGPWEVPDTPGLSSAGTFQD